jgi:hypothetical protein
MRPHPIDPHTAISSPNLTIRNYFCIAVCAGCLTGRTPQWRVVWMHAAGGEAGASVRLCNGCGIHFRKRGAVKAAAASGEVRSGGLGVGVRWG